MCFNPNLIQLRGAGARSVSFELLLFQSQPNPIASEEQKGVVYHIKKFQSQPNPIASLDDA